MVVSWLINHAKIVKKNNQCQPYSSVSIKTFIQTVIAMGLLKYSDWVERTTLCPKLVDYKKKIITKKNWTSIKYFFSFIKKKPSVHTVIAVIISFNFAFMFILLNKWCHLLCLLITLEKPVNRYREIIENI